VRSADGAQPPCPDVKAKRLDVAPEAASSPVQLHQRRHNNNLGSFKVRWTFLNVDYVGVKRHAPRWRALATRLRRPGVRLGPRYPRHTLVLEIAPPRLAPMTEQEFAHAVEILAEMLGGRDHEGDSPSRKSVIRRVRA